MVMGLDGGFDAEATSLESTLDRATESYALALRAQLAASAHDANAAPIDQTAALALVRTPMFHVGQLRWKGVEVSDEFLRYAARVARGEQLMPYRGQVLARASADFPWHAALRGNVDGPTFPTEPRLRRRKRGKTLLGWARGAGALAICMLLVGVGAAAMTDDESDAQPSWTLLSAQPARAAVPPPATTLAPQAEPAPIPASVPAVASERARRQQVRARAVHPAPPRRTSGAQSQASAQSAKPMDPARAEPIPRAEDRVMTVEGSTLLPPLEGIDSAPAASSLLLEDPSF